MISAALVGAGRMGRIRAAAFSESAEARLAVVVDPDKTQAQQVAQQTGALVLADWHGAISNPDIQVVIVATPTKFHSEVTVAALEAGKHVLCEKPLGRNVQEAERMVSAAQFSERLLKTGFNYRYMPHVQKAKELIGTGQLGPLYLVRSRFGHGGRPGYEREWHTDAELSGGGVLLEQGIHIIDLVRYLFGEPCKAFGASNTLFWDLSMVEDNFFCLLQTAQGKTAQIHVSWTQWRNIFEMEIFGRDGYLRLEGRDGHYGPPRLVWGMRNPEHSRPEERIFEYKAGACWLLEWNDFIDAIHNRQDPLGTAQDGLAAQRLIEAAYLSSRQNRWVEVPNSCKG
jgi:predicted dehydrogenase